MRAVNARLFFRIEAMNATLATKKKHPSGHVGGHRGAKTKEKPAKLPHVRAREAVAKLPPARAAVEPPPARRSVSSPIVAAAVAPALLWFSGRTGSTWLSSLLAAHAEVRFHGEVLNPHNSGSDAATLGAWLDAQAASAAAAGQRVVGFKVRPWQLGARRNASAVDADDREAALALLRRRGLRVICNCRGAFAQTVSRLRSQMLDRACGCRNLKTGDGSKCGSCAALGATPLEPGPFVSKFRSTLASHRKLAAACVAEASRGTPVLWLPYEHLDGSRAAALGEVARFLGVSAGGWAASATAGATQKVTDRNLSASVPNADALVAAVRAAGFDDDALEGGGAFACAADAAAKAKPAGKAGRARQKPP